MLRSTGQLGSLSIAAALVIACLQVLVQETFGSLLGDYTLNKHWKALHNARGDIICDKSSLNAWLFFGEQQEIEEKFRKDLEEWPKRCDYYKRLEDKFSRNEARVYDNVRKPLYEFLSDEFIQRYKQDNQANEPPIHLDTNSGIAEQRCCHPDARSEGASREAIRRLAASNGSKLAKLMSQYKKRDAYELRRALEEYFEVNLAITCETYWQMLHHHLFRGLMGATNKFMNCNWTYIASMSDEFRNGVFRYQFCRRLTSDQQLKSKYIKALAQFGTEAQ